MTFSEGWVRLIEQESSKSQNQRATYELINESPWFDGHFPSLPIFPGIAQINLAVGLVIQNLQRDGKRYSLCSLKKVRFRRLLKPGDIIRVYTEPDPNETMMYRFKILADEEIAANGTASFKLSEPITT